MILVSEVPGLGLIKVTGVRLQLSFIVVSSWACMVKIICKEDIPNLDLMDMTQDKHKNSK